MSHALPLNRLSSLIKPSATLAVSARAGQLRAQGKHVLNFSAGEPDFAPPPSVTQAVVEALRSKPVHYTPVPGLPALREGVAKRLSEFHGRSYGASEILISNGAKHSLANLFAVTLNPGDEVVIPAPYWVSYPDMVQIAGGKPVIIGSTIDQGFKIQLDALEGALTPASRYVIVNSPSNPTGVAYTAGELREIAAVIQRVAPQAWIVADDIYRTLVYDGKTVPSSVRSVAEVTDQIVVVDGLSKSHAMTGYRVGFLAGPAPMISAAAALQGQSTSGASTPAQWAAIAALDDAACAPALGEMRAAFASRRDAMIGALNQAPGVRTVTPDGAFYVFADVSAALTRTGIASDLELATWLLEEKLVATVPGSAFGAPGHLRLSFACSMEDVVEGCQRIAAALTAGKSAG